MSAAVRVPAYNLRLSLRFSPVLTVVLDANPSRCCSARFGFSLRSPSQSPLVFNPVLSSTNLCLKLPLQDARTLGRLRHRQESGWVDGLPRCCLSSARVWRNFFVPGLRWVVYAGRSSPGTRQFGRCACVQPSSWLLAVGYILCPPWSRAVLSDW
ncbi:unnamed protein product [Amoebophrya sp. A120]|nr:unnamed protein product [Amoebophrya sp. A120]|eukprot:GSA120T00008224001.1